jgi:hypothetical protein
MVDTLLHAAPEHYNLRLFFVVPAYFLYLQLVNPMRYTLIKNLPSNWRWRVRFRFRMEPGISGVGALGDIFWILGDCRIKLCANPELGTPPLEGLSIKFR